MASFGGVRGPVKRRQKIASIAFATYHCRSEREALMDKSVAESGVALGEELLERTRALVNGRRHASRCGQHQHLLR